VWTTPRTMRWVLHPVQHALPPLGISRETITSNSPYNLPFLRRSMQVERPFFQVTENDVAEAEARRRAAEEDEKGSEDDSEDEFGTIGVGSDTGGDGGGGGSADGIGKESAIPLAEESFDDDTEVDEDHKGGASSGQTTAAFDSPFKPSAAEEEYEEMLLSPSQRNRIRNKRRRKVFVAVRVRPFLPHEADDDAEGVRGVLVVRGSTIFLVNPLVFPGASSELVTDMVCLRASRWCLVPLPPPPHT